MKIASWLFVVIFGYLSYSIVRSNYKITKKNDLKYDEVEVRIPEHLCTTLNLRDEDLTFEEIESFCQNHVKNKVEKVKYKAVKWDDIKTWEYRYVTRIDRNNTIWLCITTENETVLVTDVNPMKMKRHFKKNVKEKQIVNNSNKMEIVRIFLNFFIIMVFIYLLLR